MAKIALTFGILLIVLGVLGYVGTGSAHPTALIPAALGALIGICGAVALNPKFRMHAMHGAAMLGAIGFLGGAFMVGKGLIRLAQLGNLARPAAFFSNLIMLLLCGTFVGLCVKSFIDARKNRERGFDVSSSNAK